MKTPSLLLFALAVIPALPISAQTSSAPAQNPPATAQAKPAAADPDPAYTKTITDRADKIADTLGIDDPSKKTRVRDIIVLQYRNLHAIDDVRDPKRADANKLTDKDAKAAAIKAANDESEAKRYHWHADFLAKLSVELTPDQVDKIKDGLVYDKVHVTYNAYLKELPQMTDEQKKVVMAWLVAARELAMDGGSSNEKDAIFKTYKGRINNYLSTAGYDMKAAEKNLIDSIAAPTAPAPKPATQQ